MIIRRYIVKETLKTQIAILFVLLLIFFSQKLIRILSSAVEGDIPSALVLPLLMLGISDIIDLILPLSLFLGILVAFGRLYSDSEMVAMHACGVKKQVNYQVVLFLSIVTCLFTMMNSVWLGPWASEQEELLVENAKLNPSLAGLLAGQFQKNNQNNSVIYIGDVERDVIKHVFIAQNSTANDQAGSIIIADSGKISHDESGNQIINLDNANRYEDSILLNNLRISSFENYQGIIKKQEVVLSEDKVNNNVEQLSFSELRTLGTAKAKAEYYWRISLILSVPLMAFLVIPLSHSNPRQGRLAQILPAILFYLVYFLLESSIKANAGKGRLDPAFWFYVVNGVYFILALILNFWDSITMRKLRFKLLSANAG